MADTSAISSIGQNVPSPLAIAGQVVGVNNALLGGVKTQQEITNLKTQNQQQNQDLSIQGSIRGAQMLYGLNTLSDQQLAGGKPVYDLLDQELMSGQHTPQVDAQLRSMIPPPTQADGTPTPGSAYRGPLNAMLVTTLSGPEALKAVQPTPGLAQLGGQQVPISMPGPLSPNQNFTRNGQPINELNQQPTVQQQLDRSNTIDNTPGSPTYGQPITVPSISAPGVHIPPAVTFQNGAVRPAGSPGVPGKPIIITNPNNTGNQSSVPGVSVPPQSNALPTALPPGVVSPMETSAGNYATIRADDTQYSTRNEALNHMLALSQQTTTGKGTQSLNDARNFLVSVATKIGVTTSQVDAAKADELGKMLAQYHTQISAGQTDLRTTLLGAANPSQDKTNLANEDLLRRIQMQTNYDHAAFQSAQHQIASGQATPGQFDNLVNNWKAQNNPVGFYNFKSNDEATAALKKMSGAEKAQLANALQQRQLYAPQNGTTTPTPNGQ